MRFARCLRPRKIETVIYSNSVRTDLPPDSIKTNTAFFPLAFISHVSFHESYVLIYVLGNQRKRRLRHAHPHSSCPMMHASPYDASVDLWCMSRPMMHESTSDTCVALWCMSRPLMHDSSSQVCSRRHPKSTLLRHTAPSGVCCVQIGDGTLF